MLWRLKIPVGQWCGGKMLFLKETCSGNSAAVWMLSATSWIHGKYLKSKRSYHKWKDFLICSGIIGLLKQVSLGSSAFLHHPMQVSSSRSALFTKDLQQLIGNGTGKRNVKIFVFYLDSRQTMIQIYWMTLNKPQSMSKLEKQPFLQSQLCLKQINFWINGKTKKIRLIWFWVFHQPTGIMAFFSAWLVYYFLFTFLPCETYLKF